ncbi:hypothetical protein H7I77_16210 [Mycolicibacterium novocastrense]|uniref:Uncharacterized protein n=1 Tax=Mycolicibacterium novocastrense TaxID=59813 RepID=A0AAW5SKX4_MYCNV|nr:hypothetical protein [Mycolicibacterium novocastrense]MCV7024869.1 hypothetical protein [Mycolicibacterium novocastrense]GAT11767.1 uncharacterized protein RMCN_4900 [Mycolicibacterium novocastrense]
MTEARKPIEGSVARVEDQYTLIINRGAEHRVTEGMEFAVMSDDADQIIDPETGDVIGEEPGEKLRVRVYEVHPKYSRAETFVHVARPPVRPLASLALGPEAGKGFDFLKLAGIDEIGRDSRSEFFKQLGAMGPSSKAAESINKAIAHEMANPSPVRQQIAGAKQERAKKAPAQREVTVNIGDKVVEILPEPNGVRPTSRSKAGG